MITSAIFPHDKDWIDFLATVGTVVAATAAIFAARYAYLAFTTQRGQVGILAEQLKMERGRAEARIRSTSPKFHIPSVANAWIRGTSHSLSNDTLLCHAAPGLAPGFTARLSGNNGAIVRGNLILLNMRPENDPREIRAVLLSGPPDLKLIPDLVQVVELPERDPNCRMWALSIDARAGDYGAALQIEFQLEFQNCDGTNVTQQYRYKLGDSELVHVEG